MDVIETPQKGFYQKIIIDGITYYNIYNSEGYLVAETIAFNEE